MVDVVYTTENSWNKIYAQAHHRIIKIEGNLGYLCHAAMKYLQVMEQKTATYSVEPMRGSRYRVRTLSPFGVDNQAAYAALLTDIKKPSEINDEFMFRHLENKAHDHQRLELRYMAQMQKGVIGEVVVDLDNTTSTSGKWRNVGLPCDATMTSTV